MQVQEVVSFLQLTARNKTNIITIKFFIVIFYLSNNNLFPALESFTLKLLYSNSPFTNVCVILDLKVKPSNGDQPHFAKILS